MFRVIAAVLLLALACPAQAPDAEALVAAFGPCFKMDAAFPVLTGDLDGDGKPDAVLVATCENPLLDQSEYHYKVADPFNAFFGFGDPKITQQFAAGEQHPRYLLVVHNWAAPQQKDVIINLAFEKLSIGRVMNKKKPVTAIRASEITGMKSAVYWDGKKWKWKEESIE